MGHAWLVRAVFARRGYPEATSRRSLLEFELLPEQFAHVLLAAPVAAIAGAGLARRPEGRVHAFGLRMGPPGDQAEAAARAAALSPPGESRGSSGMRPHPPGPIAKLG